MILSHLLILKYIPYSSSFKCDFIQICSSWQAFNWHRAWCGHSADGKCWIFIGWVTMS